MTAMTPRMRNPGLGRREALVSAALLAVLLLPAPAFAQRDWEVNLHAATLVSDLFEESGSAIQGGIRLVHTTPWRVTLGGNLDWARTGDVALAFADGATADLLLYSAEIGYAAPISPRADLLLAAGVGGATVRLQDVPASATLQESSNGQLIPLGAAVRVRNRDVDPWWAFRADLRDNVIFLDVPDPVSGRVDQEPRHNWEISAGISFLFGGAASSPVAQPGVARAAERPAAGQAQEPAPRPAGGPAPGPSGDADRDSVPDRLDRCAATPRELAVGPTGCPVDLDRDGAPDRRTAQIAEEPKARPIRPGPEAARRPGAAEGVRPGPPEDAAPAEDAARGVAPAAEKAAASPTACLDHRRWGRPGISIAFDERLWDQLGAPEPISLENLEPVGEFDGVPIYVGTLAREPYSELWVPRCDPAGTFQLYVEEGKAE